MYGYDHQRNGHLEDYDSALGEVEVDSRGATLGHASTRLPSGMMPNEYDESIRRGIRNAETQPNDETEKSPNAIMDAIMNGGGYSVTTRDILMERGQSQPTIDIDDTFTFDGSTITSANDITHKRSALQRSVVDFNPQAAAAAAAMNPHHPQHALHAQLKANPSKETEFTSVSSNAALSSRTEKSRARKFCCGLGKLGIVLILLAVLAGSAAVILYLVLGDNVFGNNQDATVPPASACCQGEFEQGWGGREICNVQGGCCVVCASSIVVESNPNANTGNNSPEDVIVEPVPVTAPPTPSPTTLAPEKPLTQAPDESQQTRAPDEIQQATVPPVVTTPEPTPAATTPQPTPAATTPQPTPAATTPQPTPAATTPVPTAAATTQAPTSASPTASPTEVQIVAATVPPTPGLPCCEGEPLWADYIGRIRCEETQPPVNDFANMALIPSEVQEEKCCEVCTLT